MQAHLHLTLHRLLVNLNNAPGKAKYLTWIDLQPCTFIYKSIPLPRVLDPPLSTKVSKHQSCIRAVSEIILKGGRPRALFYPVGRGCFVDNVSEGWGVTCPGGQGVFDP